MHAWSRYTTYTASNQRRSHFYRRCPKHELATAIEQFVTDPSNGAKGLARALEMERRRAALDKVLVNCRAFQKLKTDDVQLQCRNDCPEYQR
jgi:cell division protein FtsB